MSSARPFVFRALAALALAACSVETIESSGDPGDGNAPGQPGTSGTTAAQITECKGSCDKMKFFDCSSAGEQARCYADCDAATASQIELFVGCARNSICDPACRTSLRPAPPPGQPAPPPPPESVATAGSCAQACDKGVQCGFLPAGAAAECAQQCAAKAYQYQIDCVLNNACDRIEGACGGIDIDIVVEDGGETGGETGGGTGGGAGAFGCKIACDELNFFACVSADDHAACRSACDATGAVDRDTFEACVRTAGGECAQLEACYATFRD